MSTPAPTAVGWQGRPALNVQAADGARATLLLQGGQLVSWCSADGRERLYCSPAARYADNVAVRGGVPVIFPQFEQRGPDRSLPRHGLARTRVWHAVARRDGEAVRLRLCDDAATRAVWPHRFTLELALRWERNAIELLLDCVNDGDSAWSFSAALHSYLAVEHLDRARIDGLQGTRYLDTTDGQWREETAAALPVSGPIDRIHFGAGSRELSLHDAERKLALCSTGWPDVVVWNPGPALAARLDDLPVGGERRFVCIEAAAIDPPPTLAPGEHWQARHRLTASS